MGGHPSRAVDPATLALVEALRGVLDACDRDGGNLPDRLSAALTVIAMEDGSYRLIEHRPGSWEAQHVAALDLSALYVSRETNTPR